MLRLSSSRSLRLSACNKISCLAAAAVRLHGAACSAPGVSRLYGPSAAEGSSGVAQEVAAAGWRSRSDWRDAWGREQVQIA